MEVEERRGNKPQSPPCDTLNEKTRIRCEMIRRRQFQWFVDLRNRNRQRFRKLMIRESYLYDKGPLQELLDHVYNNVPLANINKDLGSNFHLSDSDISDDDDEIIEDSDLDTDATEYDYDTSDYEEED